MTDLLRGGVLLAIGAVAVVVIEGVLATEIGGMALRRGIPWERGLVTVGAVGLLALPGALGAAAAWAHLLARFGPEPRARVLREGAVALGLEIELDVPGRFVAAGAHGDRSVRLESSRGLRGRRLTAALSADARGYGAFVAPEPLGMDQAWLQSIQSDPVGARTLQLLGSEQILVLPAQLHATGHDGWLESPEILQERVRALRDLAQIAERQPPSVPGATDRLRRWAASLPDPRRPPALLGVLDASLKLGAAGLALMSLLWLGLCGLLPVFVLSGS
jgi:hypothetical protein